MTAAPSRRRDGLAGYIQPFIVMRDKGVDPWVQSLIGPVMGRQHRNVRAEVPGRVKKRKIVGQWIRFRLLHQTATMGVIFGSRKSPPRTMPASRSNELHALRMAGAKYGLPTAAADFEHGFRPDLGNGPGSCHQRAVDISEVSEAVDDLTVEARASIELAIWRQVFHVSSHASGRSATLSVRSRTRAQICPAAIPQGRHGPDGSGCR